jgi:hypothetical protein
LGGTPRVWALVADSLGRDHRLIVFPDLRKGDRITGPLRATLEDVAVFLAESDVEGRGPRRG